MLWAFVNSYLPRSAMDEMNKSMPQGGNKDAEENKLIAAISYLSILCLVGLLGKKDSPFVQHHAKQGLVLFVIEIGLMVVNIIPILGQIIWLFGSIAVMILAIMGIINAVQGKKADLPLIGDLAKKVNL